MKQPEVTKRNTASSKSPPASPKGETASAAAANVANSASEPTVDAKQAKTAHTPVVTGLWNPTGIKTLLVFTSLACVCITGFMTRLFSVIRYESIIHEFDPWFNYRATHHMVTNGYYNFLNWFDERAWYPLGRIVGGTVYPGLMITSGAIHYILNSLNITIHIREVILISKILKKHSICFVKQSVLF